MYQHVLVAGWLHWHSAGGTSMHPQHLATDLQSVLCAKGAVLSCRLAAGPCLRCSTIALLGLLLLVGVVVSHGAAAGLRREAHVGGAALRHQRWLPLLLLVHTLAALWCQRGEG